MTTVQVRQSGKARANGFSITLSTRTHFSRLHLWSARHFAETAERIETTNTKVEDAVRTEYLSAVTGAVIMSVASLEAAVNDLWAEAVDALDGETRRLQGPNPNFPQLLCSLWPSMERSPTLEKYSVALAAAEKGPFETGAEPYQATQNLIWLRNALIHFYPEWSTKQDKHKKLAKQLRDRFTISPFAASGDSWFPKKCLGYGCAAWAVRTSAYFMDYFFNRLGIESWLPVELTRFGSATKRAR